MKGALPTGAVLCRGARAVLLVLLLCGLALPGLAQSLGDEPYEITADVIEFESETGLYVAEGHVHIVQPKSGKSLDADWVVFSNETRRGAASGNVVFRDGSERLDAEFGVFNLDTLQGLLYDGGFESREDDTAARLWARQLVKTGEDTYEFWDGVFTTCNCPDDGDRDPWRIAFEKGDIELGGYGTARNATLDLLEVPVLFAPWLLFPVKTERESGVLMPEFRMGSRNGVEVGLPIFFAIGDPVNLTVTPSYIERRGFKPEADVEYVFGRKSRGLIRGSFISDDEVRKDQDKTDDRLDDREDEIADGADPLDLRVPTDDPYGSHRWFIEAETLSDLPADFRIITDLRFISDNDYPDDFRDLDEYRRDRFLESRAFGYRHSGASGRFGFVASTWFADDLQSPDDSDRDDFMMQRLPQVELRALESPLGFFGVSGRMGVDYTAFQPRNDPKNEMDVDATRVDDLFFDTGFDALSDRQEADNPDRDDLGEPLRNDPNEDNFAGGGGPEGDGRFQEGEPLADKGHRLTLHPQLSRSMRYGPLQLKPEVGYRQTLYWTDRQDSAERGTFDARADLATQLVRRFQPSEESEITHLLEPRLSVIFMEHRSQSGAPIFVPRTAKPQRRVRQLSPENAILDPADRVEDRRDLVLGLGNRIYLGGGGGEGGARRLAADFTVSSAVDWTDGELGRLILDGTTSRIKGVGTRFNLAYNPERNHLREALFDVSWNLPERAMPVIDGGQLGFRYRYLRSIPLFFESFRGTNQSRFDDFEEDFNRVSQLDLRARVNVFDNWVLGGGVTYSFEEDVMLRSRASIDYVSKCKCWSLGVWMTDSRNRGQQFTLRYTLLGLGDDTSNPHSPQNRYGTRSAVP